MLVCLCTAGYNANVAFQSAFGDAELLMAITRVVLPLARSFPRMLHATGQPLHCCSRMPNKMCILA